VSERITSLANPKVKAARALAARKEREASGLFLAEGLKIIAEAVAAGRAPRRLFFGAAAAGHPLLARAASVAGEAVEVSDAVLGKISRRDNPQTVLGVFEEAWTPLAALAGSARLVVALHRPRDPGNVGTVIRTADAAGAGGVILVGEACDPFSVEAVRASMGSIFAVPVARASEAAFAAWRAPGSGSVVGTSLTATTDYRAAGARAPVLLLMGGEQAGLTAAMTTLCDVLVKIPMCGKADSLNLAVAAGIMIYALSDT
jgi:TrmH family RNA methyltransferase